MLPVGSAPASKLGMTLARIGILELELSEALGLMHRLQSEVAATRAALTTESLPGYEDEAAAAAAAVAAAGCQQQRWQVAQVGTAPQSEPAGQVQHMELGCYDWLLDLDLSFPMGQPLAIVQPPVVDGCAAAATLAVDWLGELEDALGLLPDSSEPQQPVEQRSEVSAMTSWAAAAPAPQGSGAAGAADFGNRPSLELDAPRTSCLKAPVYCASSLQTTSTDGALSQQQPRQPFCQPMHRLAGTADNAGGYCAADTTALLAASGCSHTLPRPAVAPPVVLLPDPSCLLALLDGLAKLSSLQGSRNNVPAAAEPPSMALLLAAKWAAIKPGL